MNEENKTNARNKIILYLDDSRKVFMVYNKDDVSPTNKKILMDSVDVVYNGVNKYTESFKEKWDLADIVETRSSSNELILTLKFGLHHRKIK